MTDPNPIPTGKAFDEAVALFCEEKNVVRPAPNADLRSINSFASHFAEWWRNRVCWRLGCPVCFATATEACVTPKGRPRPDHAARVRDAEKLRAESGHGV